MKRITTKSYKYNNYQKATLLQKVLFFLLVVIPSNFLRFNTLIFNIYIFIICVFVTSCNHNYELIIPANPIDTIILFKDNFVYGDRIQKLSLGIKNNQIILNKHHNPQTIYFFDIKENIILDSLKIQKNLPLVGSLGNTNEGFIYTNDFIDSLIFVNKNGSYLKSIAIINDSINFSLNQRPLLYKNEFIYLNSWAIEGDMLVENDRLNFYSQSDIKRLKIINNKVSTLQNISKWPKINKSNYYLDIVTNFDISQNYLAYSSRTDDSVHLIFEPFKEKFYTYAFYTGKSKLEPFSKPNVNHPQSYITSYNIKNGDIERIVIENGEKYVWRIDKLPFEDKKNTQLKKARFSDCSYVAKRYSIEGKFIKQILFSSPSYYDFQNCYAIDGCLIVPLTIKDEFTNKFVRYD